MSNMWLYMHSSSVEVKRLCVLLPHRYAQRASAVPGENVSDVRGSQKKKKYRSSKGDDDLRANHTASRSLRCCINMTWSTLQVKPNPHPPPPPLINILQAPLLSSTLSSPLHFTSPHSLFSDPRQPNCCSFFPPPKIIQRTSRVSLSLRQTFESSEGSPESR